MGKFIRSIVIKEKFDDEEAVITCRPMSRVEALTLQGLGDKEVIKMVDVLLPAIEKLEGLTDAAGAPITLEDFKNNAYFLGLLGKVAAQWSEASVPSKN